MIGKSKKGRARVFLLTKKTIKDSKNIWEWLQEEVVKVVVQDMRKIGAITV